MRPALALFLIACGTSSDGPGRTGSGAPADTVTGSGEAPNFLVLLADDFGQDQMAAYGRHPDPPHTPTLDALAADGVRFRNAWAYSVCSPTRAALLTGRYGRRHGVGDTFNAASSTGELSTRELVLPAMLAQSPAGYTSIGVGKWHLAAWRSEHGADHPLVVGFDHFDGHAGNLPEGAGPNPTGEPLGYYRYEWAHDGEIGWSDTYVTTQTVDDAIARIDAAPEPWAAYVAFHAPHTPLESPPTELATVEVPDQMLATYRAMVEAMDAEIGRLLASLEPEVRARTVVVFAGDNGTSPEGTAPPWKPLQAKNTWFEGGVTVPLVISGPGVVEPGREEDALVHVVDIFPTLAELAGVGAPEWSGGSPAILDGVSLVPHMADAHAPHARTYLYTETFGHNGPPPWIREWNILRDERWKLVRTQNGVSHFYDLWDPDPDDGNEGADLVQDETHTEEQDAAWLRLNAEMDRFLAEVVYDPL